MKTNVKTRLVVIGNGMAGMRTIEELLKMSPDEFEITVFGAEPQPNYNRILLSPVLSGEMKFQDTVLNDWSWYEEHNITLHAGKPVTKIDHVRCVVEAEGGMAIPYDRLLMCTVNGHRARLFDTIEPGAEICLSSRKSIFEG